MNDVLGSIFRTLDMEKANGLANSDSDNMTVFQRYFFAQVKEKMGLDAVFFLRDTDGAPKIPLIYFSAIDFYDPEKIAELHRLAWNTCEAPLLFIVTPDQLLIYNNYTPPCRCEDGSYDYLTGLIEQISLVNDLEAQRKLLGYHRTKLETGEFWQRNLARFDIKSRVDNTLMSNLKEIRKTLLANIKGRNDGRGLDASSQAEIVHALLGRSILIKYLEERTDSDGKTVFPTDFFPAFLPNAEKYTDILVNKDATYRLFRTLENKFNGDMFPLVDYESDIITQADLTELRLFILGDSDLASSQTVLWPLYSFNVIPIQLISSIYELFFHLAEDDQSNDNGTYYTPLHLVEMLMDEVLPWEGHYYNAKILDPACGSGIFLVEAYRRLICRWKFSKQAEKISAYDLAEILQSCIFGIDINEEAIRVASFSLSLAMCDFLEPRTIWNELQFPRLLHYNLFPNDFFERKRDWEKRHFDIVIGNPPWKSEMSPAADEYIADTRLIIGDKQIAQAFTWRAMDVCPEGVICLLLPSKGFLFNRSPTTTKYRRLFFEKCDVSAIINFSVFRRYLFEHGAGPAAGVIYRVKKTDSHNEILYCTPKPQHTIEDRRRFLIEPNDICRIPFELCNDDLIWKIAMWGSPRDMDLVHSMQSMHKSLRAVLDEQKMDYAEGCKRGNRK
jgi:type I restriction-modification system DNA methylase subunit